MGTEYAGLGLGFGSEVLQEIVSATIDSRIHTDLKILIALK
jgi:hypothetical protein